MPVSVILTIEGKDFDVRRYYTSIYREKDQKGRPKSDPSWKIFIVLDGVNDTTITNWMMDPKKQVDGKLTLYNILDGSTFKEINFKKATCKGLTELFSLEKTFITSYLVITGKDIKINSAELVQNWPGR
jgi:hypothetical protein